MLSKLFGIFSMRADKLDFIQSRINRSKIEPAISKGTKTK